MEERHYQKVQQTIEPFTVKKRSKEWKRAWYKNKHDLEGYLTPQGLNKWLESVGAVRFDDQGQMYVIFNGPRTKYPRMLQLLDEYYAERSLRNLASFKV